MTKVLQRYYSSLENIYDLIIVGGGIIGVSSAYELQKTYKNLRIALVEKEQELAKHQTGHNSGVIHCGIYYQPGSLKAKLCVEGAKMSYDYFERKNIPYKKCGKLIIAFDKSELDVLNDLYNRGIANKVTDIELIDKNKIKELEPHCQGIKAIWSKNTGIVDWAVVTNNLAEDFKTNGGRIYLNYHVTQFRNYNSTTDPIVIVSKNGRVLKSKFVLTCAGLQSDLIARLTNCSPDPKIIPFRGEYLTLNPKKLYMVQRNLYPVPDPNFPFLGVHFTPRIDGSIWIGPNAILAFKREGYRWNDFDFTDLMDSLKYQGFQKLCMKYARYGTAEIFRSLCLANQIKQLQKFLPNLTLTDIQKGTSGVRAQAMDINGNLVDDFVFDQNNRIFHCRNAPSPGATSSLAIAKIITIKLNDLYKLNEL